MLSKEEFQRTFIRMMDSLRRNQDAIGEANCDYVDCASCPIYKMNATPIGNESCFNAGYLAMDIIEMVEKWGKKHPVFLQELPDHHFDREEFVSAFREIFSEEEITDLEVRCQGSTNAYDFLLYWQDDTFYIMHLASGTIISWYKHLGRSNTCNKEDFDLSDLKTFLTLLKEDLDLLPARGGVK